MDQDNGWTKTGTRPEFKLVTGVSTGALIAPFDFLGKDYDDALKLFTPASRRRTSSQNGSLPPLSGTTRWPTPRPLGNFL
jgi:hypothetical protein